MSCPAGTVVVVTHLKLSVTEPHVLRSPTRCPLDAWMTAATRAQELCLVLNAEATVAAASVGLERLLDVTGTLMGRHIFDGMLGLLDFADGSALTDDELGKIPPVLALTSRRLVRGLLRVTTAHGACTLDAVATPLEADHTLIGSLTFFCRV